MPERTEPGRARQQEAGVRSSQSVYVDQAQWQALDRLSAERDISKSYLVRQALARYLREENR